MISYQSLLLSTIVLNDSSKQLLLICRFKNSEKRFENYISTCVVTLSLYISYLLCRESVTI